jgi:N-acetylglutamate synthase-like GNAT family acetyltransferase
MDFYVYEADETIIGVSAIEKKCEDQGELKWIYVLPERQRKGIGTKLVRHLEGVAKDLCLSEMTLFTDEKATWAINFYKKMGYKQIDKRKLPWGHDIMMKKKLSPIN